MNQLLPIIRRARRPLLPEGEAQKETEATEVVGGSKLDLPSPSPQPERVSSCAEASPATPGEGKLPEVDRDTDAAGKSNGATLQADLSLMSTATKSDKAPASVPVEPDVPTPANKRAKSKAVSKTA